MPPLIITDDDLEAGHSSSSVDVDGRGRRRTLAARTGGRPMIVRTPRRDRRHRARRRAPTTWRAGASCSPATAWASRCTTPCSTPAPRPRCGTGTTSRRCTASRVRARSRTSDRWVHRHRAGHALRARRARPAHVATPDRPADGLRVQPALHRSEVHDADGAYPLLPRSGGECRRDRRHRRPRTRSSRSTPTPSACPATIPSCAATPVTARSTATRSRATTRDGFLRSTTCSTADEVAELHAELEPLAARPGHARSASGAIREPKSDIVRSVFEVHRSSRRASRAFRRPAPARSWCGSSLARTCTSTRVASTSSPASRGRTSTGTRTSRPGTSRTACRACAR